MKDLKRVREAGDRLFSENRWTFFLFYFLFLLLSILLHALLLVAVPQSWWEGGEDSEKKERLSVEILTKEQVPPEWRYFESNPEVPNQLQDEETPLISDKDQQAAQPEEALEKDVLLPEIKGDQKDANKVSAGDRLDTEMLEALFEQATETDIQQANQAGGRAPQPNKMEDSMEGDSPGGLVNKRMEDEDASEVSERPEDRVVVLGPEGVGGEVQGIREPQSSPKPRPRPRVKASNLPGPLLSSSSGSHRIGAVTANTRFHEFGDYMSRMIEAIGYQWYSLIDATFRSSTMATGTVKIRFTLNKEGIVEKVEVLEKEGVNHQAVLLCQDAVMALSPFSSWTDAMTSLLGDSQEITINFIYGP